MTRKTELLPPAAVEDSLSKLAQLVSSFDAHAFAAHKEKAAQWRESVEATRWLTGIRRLFEATAKVVTQLQLGNPVPLPTPPLRAQLRNHELTRLVARWSY